LLEKATPARGPIGKKGELQEGKKKKGDFFSGKKGSRRRNRKVRETRRFEKTFSMQGGRGKKVLASKKKTLTRQKRKSCLPWAQRKATISKIETKAALAEREMRMGNTPTPEGS